MNVLHGCLGLTRLRQILGVHEWDQSECECFRTYSPCLGRQNFDHWLHSFVAAVDGTEDVDSMPLADVRSRLKAENEWEEDAMKHMRLPELRAELRQRVTNPGAVLPHVVVPAR